MTMSNQGEIQGRAQPQPQQEKQITIGDVMDGWERVKKAFGKVEMKAKKLMRLSEDIENVEYFLNDSVRRRSEELKPKAREAANLPPAASVREAMRRSAENGGARVPVELSLGAPTKGPQLVKEEKKAEQPKAEEPKPESKPE